MTRLQLVRGINHTLLKPESLAPWAQRVAAEGLEHQFASVCVAPIAAACLAGEGEKLDAVKKGKKGLMQRRFPSSGAAAGGQATSAETMSG
jgi:deoxyribose-phosphate aldolase